MFERGEADGSGSTADSTVPLLTPAVSPEVNAPDECRFVHELVSARSLANPSALALASHDGALSYRQLDRGANQLANRLRSLGVGPDVLVGLCMERSPALGVAALGILKAGGAYVAVDPSYPEERIAFMLQDSQVSVFVTQASVVPRLQRAGAVAVILDDRADPIRRENVEAPAIHLSSRNLAYVIYTSGSTGAPKGVMIEHGGLLNLVHWHLKAFAVTANDRASQVASPAFDATVWELWPYLVAGASVHFPDEAIRADMPALRDWMDRNQITIGFLPTPLAEAALDLRWPPTTPLRILLTGGDTLHRYPGPGLPFVLVNNYGPTEATVVATSGVVPATESAVRPPSIGRPIRNSRLHIVDSALQPVPVGSQGELLIGGEGVARGYLNQPALTDEKFIHDPFTDQPEGRLYRTGDLVRERPDGELEFGGRIDEQIKIRGFRVEPAEVSIALDAHPGVRCSAVIARERRPGDQTLVAYVVPTTEGRPQADELRANLAQRLPDYMIPSDFVYLQQLPLTSNGKLDRNALPTPEKPVDPSSNGFRAPNTKLEQEHAALVAELLGIERVGLDENFFMLGGHSLMAAELVTKIRDRFGVEMALISIFESGTVAGLAAEVERLLKAKVPALSSDTLAVVAQPTGTWPTLFFLVSDESGLTALHHYIGALGAEQPVVGLVPPRKNRRFERGGNVVQLAEPLLAAICERQPHGPYCLCGHSLGGLLAYEIAGRLRSRGEEVGWLGLLDTLIPAASRVALAHERRLGSRWRRYKTRAQQIGVSAALREMGVRRVQRLRASVGLPLLPDQFDFPGADALTVTYRVTAHDAPLDVFATNMGREKAGRPGLGWEELHRGPLRWHPVPGDHHTLLHEPDGRALAIFTERVHAAQTILAGA